MPDADRAMMCGPMCVPGFNKAPGARGKPVVAVGVADPQSFTRDRLALCHDQLEAAIGSSTTDSRVAGPCFTLISTESPLPTSP